MKLYDLTESRRILVDIATGLVAPSRDLAEPVALSPTMRHSLAEGRNNIYIADPIPLVIKLL